MAVAVAVATTILLIAIRDSKVANKILAMEMKMKRTTTNNKMTCCFNIWSALPPVNVYHVRESASDWLGLRSLF